jgi:hypothetical protein
MHVHPPKLHSAIGAACERPEARFYIFEFFWKHYLLVELAGRVLRLWVKPHSAVLTERFRRHVQVVSRNQALANLRRKHSEPLAALAHCAVRGEAEIHANSTLPTELIRLGNVGIVYLLNILDPIRGAQRILMIHDCLLYLVSDRVAFDLVIMIAVDLDAMALFQSTLRRCLLETDSAASATTAHKSQDNARLGGALRGQVPKHWNPKLRSV